MLTNSPPNVQRPGPRPAPASGSGPTPAASFPSSIPSRGGQRLSGVPLSTKRFILLLGIILLGGILGSISLTQQFLFKDTTKTSSPASGTQTVAQCIALPDSTNYLPASPQEQQRSITPLPAAWFEAGLEEKDYAYVHACASDFVRRYQTFTASQVATLEASTFMFSPGARQRFYGRSPHASPDLHMDKQWREDIQKHKQRQSALAHVPYLLDARYSNQHLFAWLVVPYELTITRDGKTVNQQGSTTILLLAVPHNGGPGTGWQVSAWKDGAETFPAPDPL